MRIPTGAPFPFWVFSKAGSRPGPARFSCTDGCRGIAIKSKPDDRARLSRIYIPKGPSVDGADTLIRAGFLHLARAGMFHMLPLGLKVQKKLEALIDRYMSELGASKVELSSISSEAAWAETGRLSSNNAELFRFTDRHKKKLLLSPTHEEEITHMVTNVRESRASDRLPLRLYQITRKYRDEKRPRQGLLRAREFLMKDLYTFDQSKSLALSTYAEVRQIYTRLFDELKIPYLVAEADSGEIGGNLSHEYHLPASAGEDCVITCDRCGYTANEEVATKMDLISTDENGLGGAVDCWQGISKDKSTLVFVWYGSKRGNKPEVNTHAIQAIFPDLDSSIENPMEHFKAQKSSKAPKLLSIVDGTFPKHLVEKLELKFQNYDWGISDTQSQEPEFLGTIANNPISHKPLDLLRIQNGDACSKCADGKLSVQKAIEVGHTFHLGTRYSKPLTALTAVPSARIQAQKEDFDVAVEHCGLKLNDVPVWMQMGCHGIGVSRIIGAVSSILADDKGLNWPRVIAPFEVVVITLDFKAEVGIAEAAGEVYDIISSSSQVSGQTTVDVVLDDRAKSFAWKMKDADIVGYPVIVLLGKRWTEERIVEVQCRRLKVKTDVPVGELLEYVRSLLDQL